MAPLAAGFSIAPMSASGAWRLWRAASHRVVVTTSSCGGSYGGSGRATSSVPLTIAGVVAGAAALAVAPKPACSSCEQPADGSAARLDRWRQSWRIPLGKNPLFHMPVVNPLLEKHLPRLLGDAPLAQKSENGPGVFVPLCGKTLDMSFLAGQGLTVVGVEGIGRPVFEFRDEQRCRSSRSHLWEPDPTKGVCLKGFKDPQPVGLGSDGWVQSAIFESASSFEQCKSGYVFKKGKEGLGCYSDSPKIWSGQMVDKDKDVLQPFHVLQGDMFDVSPALISGVTSVKSGKFDMVYDRAALVAISPPLRERYVETVAGLMNLGARWLLVAVDYDQSQVPEDPSGKRRVPPPFSVTSTDIQRLFPAGSWLVEEIDAIPSDLPQKSRSFANVEVTERVFLITKQKELKVADRQRPAFIGKLLAGAGLGAAVLLGVFTCSR